MLTLIRSLCRRRIFQFGIVAVVAFLAGIVWFKDRLWPYYVLEDIYVRLKYEMTGGTVRTEPDGSVNSRREPDLDLNRLTYTPKSRTLSELERISRRLRMIGFGRTAELVNTSVQAGGQLDYGLPEKPLETPAVRIERFVFDIGAGCQSVSWLLHPRDAREEIEKLLIVHQGHDSHLTDAPVHPSNDVAPAINKALDAGLHVGVFHIPMWSHGNACSIEFVDHIVGSLRINNHTTFEYAPGFENVFGFHPFTMFLSPVKAYIDLLEKRSPGMRVYITGLSGGGWMSTVYAAADERIEIAFPVAGNMPYSIRSRVPQDLRDYETTYISTFADYSDLYVLATMRNGRFERRHRWLALVGSSGRADRCRSVAERGGDRSRRDARRARVVGRHGARPAGDPFRIGVSRGGGLVWSMNWHRRSSDHYRRDLGRYRVEAQIAESDRCRLVPIRRNLSGMETP